MIPFSLKASFVSVLGRVRGAGATLRTVQWRRLREHLRRAVTTLLREQWMWVEVVVITLTALGLGLFLERDNPLQIGGEFPWIWIAPLLVALRYGVAAGVVSSLILVAFWAVEGPSGQSGHAFPQQYFIGGLILVLLSGQFSSGWEGRLRRAEETNRYLDERVRRITLRHLLLRLSHDHLEHEMLAKPGTLRDALTDLRKLAAEDDGSDMPAAPALLQLLTQYCQLESAGIYVAARGGKGYVKNCGIGTPPDLSATDPLLLHALQHESLSHLLTDGLGDVALPSPFLVVAPILSSDGHLAGVLAIDHMPFLALNEENLQMLAVMLGYYADCVSESEDTRRFSRKFPDAPADFAAEFARMLRLQRNHGVNSHVVVLSFDNDEGGRQAITQHELVKRSLDITWHWEAGDRMILANLMPLANEAAVQEYLLRIENKLTEQIGSTYDERGPSHTAISLAESDPAASLERATAGAGT